MSLCYGLYGTSCNPGKAFDNSTIGRDSANIRQLYARGMDAVDTGNRAAGSFYFRKGIAASHAAGNIVYEGKGYQFFSYLYMTCGQQDSATGALRKALDIFRDAGYKGPVYLSCRIALLSQYMAEDNFVRVADEGHELLAEARAIKDTTSIGQTLGMLSLAANRLTDNQKAVWYLEEAVSLVAKTDNTTTLEDLQGQLAMAYDHTGQFVKELRTGYALLTVSKPGSVNSGYTFATLSRAHYGLGHMDSALHYLNKVTAVNASFGDPALDASISSGLIDIYLSQKKYPEALSEIDRRIAKGLDASDSGDIPALQGRRSEALEALGRYREALQAQRVSEQVKNYESGEEIHRQVALIEGKYRTREKERAIETLSRTNTVQQRWLIVVISLLCLTILLTILSLLQYRRQRRATKLISHQAERLQWLMKEVHHRVKNNLQVVISLIHMQLLQQDNGPAESLLNDTVTRIHSIALIHQKLYQNNNQETVAVKDYLDQLLQAIVAVHGQATAAISSEIELDIDTAVILGMVVSELTTNSCKHARLPDRDLQIDIRVDRASEGYTMRYCDNGPGIPEKPAANTMGMQIIHLMVRQMAGAIDWSNKDGACCHIQFKDEAQRKLTA
jgi:two-component sensor histidine kinase